jgi:catechol 2,3-dioxygenase-like lactoylglutathione lyase family enzyme
MMSVTVPRTAQLLSVTPRLRVRDIVLSAEFYRDRLGFTIANYEGRPPVRALVERDALRLVLDVDDSEMPHDGVELEFGVDDFEALMDELKRRGLELERGGFGPGRWFSIKDTDGHTLRFVDIGI